MDIVYIKGKPETQVNVWSAGHWMWSDSHLIAGLVCHLCAKCPHWELVRWSTGVEQITSGVVSCSSGTLCLFTCLLCVFLSVCLSRSILVTSHLSPSLPLFAFSSFLHSFLPSFLPPSIPPSFTPSLLPSLPPPPPSLSLLSLSLCLSLSVCLYICLSLSVSVCLCLSLSVSVCLCLSLSVSVCLCLSLLVSVCLRLCLNAAVCLCLPVSVSLLSSLSPLPSRLYSISVDVRATVIEDGRSHVVVYSVVSMVWLLFEMDMELAVAIHIFFCFDCCGEIEVQLVGPRHVISHRRWTLAL